MGKTKLIILLLMFSSLTWADEPNTIKTDVNGLQPGKEIPLIFEGDKLVLYLPQDYNDIKAAPVIFYYPSQGGKPSTSFFQLVTESKGFVIIGMSYTYEPNEPVSRSRYSNYLKSETIRMGKLNRYLQRELNLRIDDSKLFISGISKGGWFTSEVIEYRPQPWAGAIIIAAGRVRATQYSGIKNLTDKPIYIGVGETDVNRSAGERAYAFYRSANARVTFEIYKGLGHDAKSDSAILRQWLKDLSKQDADSAGK